jgi:hypothetical protein
MHSLRARAAAAFLSLLVFACTSTSSKQTVKSSCTPGDQKDCSCTSGSKGAQICKPDGTGYETCVCGSSGGSGGGGAGGSGGGSGGSSGDGGASGGGGSSNDGSASGGSFGAAGDSGDKLLGARCTSAADCGGSLECFRDLSAIGLSGSIAKGLCSKECAQDGDCPGGRCAPFSGAAGICVESCEFGPQSLSSFDPNKCHGRPELACSVLDGPPACLPTCNNDTDCDPGQLCNAKNGLCENVAVPGAPLGSNCDSADPFGSCHGICIGVQDTSGGSIGMCTQGCTVGHSGECGWTGSGAREGICAFTPNEVVAGGGPGFGDIAFCALLCNCTGECRQPGLRCYDGGGETFRLAYGKPGICAAMPGGSTEISVCIGP